jgi:predicted transposase/invertase (TIGR01784 family)
MSRYINPYTDFGFKKLFGQEAHPDLLIDFLNTFLPEKHQIKTLEFQDKEQLGPTPADRRAVFDVYCENDKGEKFIVEMQKAEEAYFKDRSLYYVAHPIRAQGQKGKWDFNLKTVYFIGILDFVYDKDDPNPLLIREVALKDQHGKVFYDKLKMTYIQMPVFTKTEEELKTRQEKWLYFLKNLPSLKHIPAILKKEKVFQKAFQLAELAAMPETERRQYERNLYHYWTYLGTIEFASREGEAKGRAKGKAEGRAEGRAKGRAEGKAEGKAEGRAEGKAEGETQKAIEIARNLKQEGLPPALIAKTTGLPETEITEL